MLPAISSLSAIRVVSMLFTSNYNSKVIMNDSVRTAVNNMDTTLIADELEIAGSNAVHFIFHVTYLAVDKLE
jgi:hypothetical protein